jgi:hypothetical protein
MRTGRTVFYRSRNCRVVQRDQPGINESDQMPYGRTIWTESGHHIVAGHTVVCISDGSSCTLPSQAALVPGYEVVGCKSGRAGVGASSPLRLFWIGLLACRDAGDASNSGLRGLERGRPGSGEWNPAAARYRTAMVTPGCEGNPPTDMDSATAIPGVRSTGTNAFTCRAPEIRPGAPP